jgi:hypothetical protein
MNLEQRLPPTSQLSSSGSSREKNRSLCSDAPWQCCKNIAHVQNTQEESLKWVGDAHSPQPKVCPSERKRFFFGTTEL